MELEIDPEKLSGYCLNTSHPLGKLFNLLLRDHTMKSDSSHVELLDVVALLCDHVELGAVTGQVGTVVEVLDSHTVEVEFITKSGEMFAQGPVPMSDLLLLHYSPVAA